MVIDDHQGEAGVLRRLQVRELREEERAEFDWRLQTQHYLASSVLVGPTLRYVCRQPRCSLKTEGLFATLSAEPTPEVLRRAWQIPSR